MGEKSELVKKLCDEIGIPYKEGPGYATLDGVPMNELEGWGEDGFSMFKAFISSKYKDSPSMVLCDQDCIPCCDFCIHCVHDVDEEFGALEPIACSRYMDKEHNAIVEGCGFCSDFHCRGAL